ncbi:MAG: DUF1844 domain-containing protein [Armatimonadota bacterium]|nr:DUF1844 domain-containing protein [bacterium]
MAEEPQEEKTYEVKDKRRVNSDGTLREEQPEEPKTKQATTEEQAEDQTGFPPPNVYAMMEFMIQMLSEQAWQLMGIRLAPGQKEMVKDLTQAKIAIDTIVFLVDKLHPHIEERDRLALRAMISDLQLNFVKQNA